MDDARAHRSKATAEWNKLPLEEPRFRSPRNEARLHPILFLSCAVSPDHLRHLFYFVASPLVVLKSSFVTTWCRALRRCMSPAASTNHPRTWVQSTKDLHVRQICSWYKSFYGNWGPSRHSLPLPIDSHLLFIIVWVLSRGLKSWQGLGQFVQSYDGTFI